MGKKMEEKEGLVRSRTLDRLGIDRANRIGSAVSDNLVLVTQQLQQLRNGLTRFNSEFFQCSNCSMFQARSRITQADGQEQPAQKANCNQQNENWGLAHRAVRMRSQAREASGKERQKQLRRSGML